MIERSVSERYRGSTIGIGWSVLQPMMMLGIYSFIFSTVFKSRWTNAPETGTLGYALNMFAGIIVFNIAAESIGGAVSCVRNNKSYVKKLENSMVANRPISREKLPPMELSGGGYQQ